MQRIWIPIVLVGVLSASAADAREGRPGTDAGHSEHGSAFDTGLRQRPWKMDGIGHSHFAVTTKVPEVQEWFDQGNTLLHSFWFEEAERSFRWALKLDPNCAMAYLGLAQTSLNWFTGPDLDDPGAKRGLEFLKEAVKRKGTASPRERMYIEAWDDAFTGESQEHGKVLAGRLLKIVLAFPDDVEAKALYALYSMDLANGYSTELVIRQVLEKEPDHPGAHHYRIHNWDDTDAVQGLPSCRRYGQVAPGIGHANHMPGHNYSKIGMWHEAAISMDSATRVELRYMNERLALPFETWNFAHNRNYLCFLQEQLGREQAALAGARALLSAPRDPERNKDGDYGAFDQGLIALVRALVKFERWDQILESGTIPWRDTDDDTLLRAFAEAMAHIGKGELADARSRIAELRAGIAAEAKDEQAGDPSLAILTDAAEGLLRAADGDILEATHFLTQAAALERKARDTFGYPNDPPPFPWLVDRLLGDVYLESGELRLAIAAYQRALETLPNDAFSLAGLARARAASGDRVGATRDAGRLAHVWSGADAGLRWQQKVDALGLAAKPVADTPAPERPYRPAELDTLGPVDWRPFPAPELAVLDTKGKAVRLEDYKGHNVLLVFYLNEECIHCVEQLVKINDRAADWTTEKTVVLAVSSATPEENHASEKLGGLAMTLLSDTDHAAARRFTSYDDFEELELHSTILIDAEGQVRWKRTGGDPFTDIDFLVGELKRINESGAVSTVAPQPGGVSTRR